MIQNEIGGNSRVGGKRETDCFDKTKKNLEQRGKKKCVLARGLTSRLECRG